MKLIHWIFAVVIVILTIDFVMTNNQSTSFGSWFLPGKVEIPVGLVVLLALATGLLVGGFITWTGGARTRRRARMAERQVESLQREMAELARRTDDAEREAATIALPSPDSENVGPSPDTPPSAAADGRT
jgi:uncharacterized integral membrane protein